MNDNDIRSYDDALLSKERGIKVATTVINIVIALAFAVGILFRCGGPLEDQATWKYLGILSM